MPSQPILIHYHIYKNAGSSIDRLLRENFGDHWTTCEQQSAVGITSCSHLKAFLETNPHVRAVSSHSARPPLPTPSALPILFLRHPIDRARSVYDFARRDATQPDHNVARAGNFSEYVRYFLSRRDAGVVIRNYQVVHLSEASFRCQHVQLAEANAGDMEYCKALLKGWGVFGLVRRFADSCELFSLCYTQEFPKLRLYDLQENASADTANNDEEAMSLARIELGDETFNRLVDANQLDLQLYEYARQLFEERLTIIGFNADQRREQARLSPYR